MNTVINMYFSKKIQCKLVINTLKVKVKCPIQPTLRLLGAEQCRQIALFRGCDTTRAPHLEALPFPRETRGTHCIDPEG